uniref:Secreted protein n=1 Tax=Strongyloides venezuelensis TaxID=75913 RepID=A0A0K0FPE4_STRVS
MIYRNLGVFTFFLIFTTIAANYFTLCSGRDHVIQNDLIKKTTLKESVRLRSLMVVWPFIGVARPPATCVPADTF